MISASPSSQRDSALDELYSSNLLYVPDCWKLCGDAHCCGFSRYKKRFKILTSQPFQSLPMLLGEYDHSCGAAGADQFGEHDGVTEYAIDDRVVRAGEVVSWR
ncbi:MAG: hypothetical protein R3E65_05925 [Steroidobacteraceae bacterium]